LNLEFVEYIGTVFFHPVSSYMTRIAYPHAFGEIGVVPVMIYEPVSVTVTKFASTVDGIISFVLDLPKILGCATYAVLSHVVALSYSVMLTVSPASFQVTLSVAVFTVRIMSVGFLFVLMIAAKGKDFLAPITCLFLLSQYGVFILLCFMHSGALGRAARPFMGMRTWDSNVFSTDRALYDNTVLVPCFSTSLELELFEMFWIYSLGTHSKLTIPQKFVACNVFYV
jgi:hypothetical protein